MGYINIINIHKTYLPTWNHSRFCWCPFDIPHGSSPCVGRKSHGSPREMCVWCVVGGCGYVLVPRDVKKKEKKTKNKKSDHSCPFVLLLVLVCSFCLIFSVFFDYCSLLVFFFGFIFLLMFALVGSFWLMFVFCLFRAHSCLLNMFFMFISALSLYVVFCIYLPLCSLNVAYLCSFLLLFAQFCSV